MNDLARVYEAAWRSVGEIDDTNDAAVRSAFVAMLRYMGSGSGSGLTSDVTMTRARAFVLQLASAAASCAILKPQDWSDFNIDFALAAGPVRAEAACAWASDALMCMAQVSWARAFSQDARFCYEAVMTFLSEVGDEALGDPTSITLLTRRLAGAMYSLSSFYVVFLQQLPQLLLPLALPLLEDVAALPPLLRPAAAAAVLGLAALALRLAWATAREDSKDYERLQALQAQPMLLAQNLAATRGHGVGWRQLSGAVEDLDLYCRGVVKRTTRNQAAQQIIGDVGRASAAAFRLVLARPELALMMDAAVRRRCEAFADRLDAARQTAAPLMELLQYSASEAVSAAFLLDWAETASRRPAALLRTLALEPELRLDAKHVVEGYQLTVCAVVPWGAHVCVDGESGVGKSMILAIARGALKPTYGGARLGDVDPTTLLPKEISTSVLHAGQSSALTFLSTSVRDALLVGRGTRGGSLATVPDEALTPLLADVGLEHVSLSAAVARLSGGERQRLALARVLFDSGGKALLLDEPFSALGEAEELRLLRLLLDRARGQTVLLVSHRAAAADIFPHLLRVSLVPASEGRRATAHWVREPTTTQLD
jgi:ABC-type thiamine transport system ATPase subunit